MSGIYLEVCAGAPYEKEDWYFRRNLAAKQIGVGIPMGLQYSITAIGTMMVQSALNMLGSYAVAAFTAGSKIEQIFTQAYVAQELPALPTMHRISEPESLRECGKASGLRIL